MKIAIFGIGGVGGYFGARLASAGHEVFFIVREETYNLIKDDKLILYSGLGDLTITARYETNTDLIGHVDLVIVAVKAWQLRDILDKIKPLLGLETLILPLQNGVESISLLSKYYGLQNVLGGVCWIISYKEAPGIIRHNSGNPQLIFGSLVSKNESLVHLYNELKNVSGFDTKLSNNIDIDIWDKLLHISSASGVASLARTPVGVWREMEGTRSIFIQAMNEILYLANKKNIKLEKGSVDKSLAFVDALNSTATFSMQRDFQVGNPTELDYILGSILKMSKKLNLELPINELIYSLLQPLDILNKKNHVRTSKYLAEN